MSTRRDPRKVLGDAGEDLVARWYRERGATVLDRNWRTRSGEIDLVVADGSTVAFCEVKTRRRHDFGSPFDAVTRAKQQRLRGLALAWLRECDVRAVAIRFDVAAVTWPADGVPTVEIVTAAF